MHEMTTEIQRQRVRERYQKYKHVPEFRRVQYLRLRIKIRKKNIGKPHARPHQWTIEQLQDQLIEAQFAWRKLYWSKFKTRATPKATEAGRAQHQSNMALSSLRKQARKEWRAFVAAYNEKWGPILKNKTGSKKRCKKRREQILRSTRDPKDETLLNLMSFFRSGESSCYWCLVAPATTVDHITPLAKGGRHISANLCGACHTCNSLKSDKLNFRE